MKDVGFNRNVIYETVHNKLYNGANGQQKGGNTIVADADNAFHVYLMEWTIDKITFAVKSVPYFTYNHPKLGAAAGPYNKDFLMTLNVAVGGNWSGQKGVDDSIFPQQMIVDYVRGYQKQ